jgi:hypothetical protein
MRDVRHPVGKSRELGRDAGAAPQVDAVCVSLVVGGQRLGHRAVPLGLTRSAPATAAGKEHHRKEGK